MYLPIDLENVPMSASTNLRHYEAYVINNIFVKEKAKPGQSALF